MRILPLVPPKNAVFARFSPEGSQDKLRVPLGADFSTPHFCLYTGPATVLRAHTDPASGARAWLWGRAGVEGVMPEQVVGWALAEVMAGRSAALKQMSGSYVLILYDERARQVSVATDLLAARPLFVHQTGREVLLGSDAWTMKALGWTSAQTSPEAISSWMCFNYNMTDRALFEDLRRPRPATLETFDSQLVRSTQTYAQPDVSLPGPDPQSYPEVFHEVCLKALKAQAQGVDRVTVALSGGYDTRYLLGTYMKYLGGTARGSVVDFGPFERRPAQMVADRLGMELSVAKPGVFEATGSLWDLFDEPCHYTPDGFPMTRQFSYYGAVDGGGLPLLNGYLGDLLMRGTRTQCGGKHEWEVEGELVDQAYPDFDTMTYWWNLVEPKVGQGARRKGRAVLSEMLSRDGGFGYAFRYADLYGRQRHYIANNVNQCLDECEFILPFLNFELMQLRFSVGRKVPGIDDFKKIFERFLPEIADVPHSSELDTGPTPDHRLGSNDRIWAYEVLKTLPRRGGSILTNLGSIKAIAGNVWLGRHYPRAVHHMHRIHQFEGVCAHFGLRPDWRGVRA